LSGWERRCSVRAQRRRSFKARTLCQTHFGLRRQSGSGDGAFETERHIRLVRPAQSPPHAQQRCRVRLATAVQNRAGSFHPVKYSATVLDCAGRAQRRRRFRNGAAHSIGQTRSVATTRSTAVSRPTCHRSPKSPASFHACQQNPVAACPGTPTECSGNLLCHGQHVFAPASFQGKGQASRVASRVA